MVPQDEFAADPGGAIMRHTNLAEAEIERRRRLIGRHLPDILYDVPASRVAENILRAASLAKCEKKGGLPLVPGASTVIPR